MDSNHKKTAEATGMTCTCGECYAEKLAKEEMAELRTRLVQVLHTRSLGLDQDRGGQFMKYEAIVARYLEGVVGRRMRRALKENGEVGDLVDSAGRVYDIVGPVPQEHFDMTEFRGSILDHLRKKGVDKVPLVIAGLSAEQKAEVKAALAQLTPEERSKIMLIDDAPF